MRKIIFFLIFISAYAACLARHNTYLAEVTGQRDISYQSTVHDIKILISKFAQERSFAAEAGGGGPHAGEALPLWAVGGRLPPAGPGVTVGAS